MTRTVEEIRSYWTPTMGGDMSLLLAEIDRLRAAHDRITSMCDVFDDQADEMQTISLQALEGGK